MLGNLVQWSELEPLKTTYALVAEEEIQAWTAANPQPYDRAAYQGLYEDIHGGLEEPHFQYIQHLAEHGLFPGSGTMVGSVPWACPATRCRNGSRSSF